MRREAALIAGGGPAGSAAAIALARGGARPLIVERQRETGDALCGGFLSWHTLEALGRIGIAVEGHAIDRVRLFAGSHAAEARLPARAIGVSRRRLDTAMLGVAESLGARVERGVTVREIEGMTLRTDDGDFEGEALFLATGKHDVRGCARPRSDGDATLGLRVKLGPHPALAALIGSAIELHLFDRGYAGLLMQEGGRANLCLAVRKSRLLDAGGKPETLLAEIARGTPLGERLAFMDAAPAIDAIASVPYGWRATTTAPGVFRLGDQAAVIPSLAGEGIGIAIASGIAAAQACLHGTGAPEYQQAFAARTRRPIAAARLIWALGERPFAASAATRVASALPSLARLLARMTRIGD
ncbi:MAG: FAD-dependent monooxygenase [Sphingomonadaceae bacterium]|nr:FAD-dependent monooxygenase [Sphingomonadaceae bacterium]